MKVGDMPRLIPCHSESYSIWTRLYGSKIRNISLIEQNHLDFL